MKTIMIDTYNRGYFFIEHSIYLTLIMHFQKINPCQVEKTDTISK